MNAQAGFSSSGKRNGSKAMDYDVLKYTSAIKRRLLLIILIAVLTGALTYYLQDRRADTYTATAKIFIGNAINSPNPNLEQITLGQELVITYAELIRSYDLIATTVEELALSVSPDSLLDAVSTQVINDTSIIIIRVKYSDPETAATIANTLAQNLISTSPMNLSEQQQQQLDLQDTEITRLQEQIREMSERSLVVQSSLNEATLDGDMARIEVLSEEYNRLNEQINTAGNTLTRLSENLIALTNQANRIEIFERARPPRDSDGMNPLFGGVAGVIAGGILTTAVVLFFEYINTTIRSPREARHVVQLPVLGTLPRLSDMKSPADYLLDTDDKLSRYQEQFLQIYTGLHFSGSDGTAASRSFILSSVRENDERTFLTVNLARQFATMGARTLLIDADVVRPMLHQVFDLPNERGLLSMVKNAETSTPKQLRSRTAHCMQAHPEIPYLNILTIGAEAATMQPGSINWIGLKAWVAALLEDESYDILIWDTPARSDGAYTQNLAAITQSDVLLLLKAGHVHYEEVLLLKESLTQIGLRIPGMVIMQ